MNLEKFWHLSEDEMINLNPPEKVFKVIKGKFYEEVFQSDDWISVGYIPIPKTKFQWFIYHFVHGLWMGYSFWKDDLKKIN